MNEISPLMAQYRAIKEQYKDEVLFFRLGDFYEMFDEDALEISRLLNLTLTHRAGNPMCGVPYHSAGSYIGRLLRFGKKIAVCEQVGMPSGKGLAERKVVEVITPGTAVEEEYLDQGVHNYLAAVCPVSRAHADAVIAFSYIDVSTGAFFAASWNANDMREQFAREIGRVQPREILLAESLRNNPDAAQILSEQSGCTVSYYPDWHFSADLAYKRLLHQFGTVNLRAFSLTEHSPEIVPAGFLLEYLAKTAMQGGTQQDVLPHVMTLKVYCDSEFLIIDESSRRNLEISANLHDGSVRYSLLETVNYTVTPMGNRCIRSWLLHPLTDPARIRKRQSQVELLFSRPNRLRQLRDSLKPILDIERLAGRIAMERAHAKDLQALRQSLEAAVSVLMTAEQLQLLHSMEIDAASQIADLIKHSVLEDPSTSLTEGRLIKPGYSAELDRLHQIHDNFNAVLNAYLEEEKEKTGIQNLKIRSNRLIGYYLEVSRGKLENVPAHFMLRRSLVNGDRYSTERLQELEHELLDAGEKIIAKEHDLFIEIRSKIAERVPYLLDIASEIAHIDVYASFAQAAALHNWVCPEIEEESVFEIEKGRHPVVEMHLPPGKFIPNDADLCRKPFALITGPNMAGKSTYLRQNALIVVLAQTGSFVPAAKARLGIADRVFCRVGASDNLARGESTFLVEMAETAHILHSATEKSLVIMDEIGRGTSTEDGLSIAWAVSEYLLNTVKSKTFFATHYHELSRLEHPALQQLCLDVLEEDGQIVFLKQIKQGASASSYGLHVAKLAGIPETVISRAYEILKTLCRIVPYTDNGAAAENPRSELPDSPQSAAPRSLRETDAPSLFDEEELVIDAILSTETDSITPLEALQKIAEWKKTLSQKSR
ncbi:MAG: DNA mismatch repair protein MutS [Bacteroides sp.]|nr:DNA mismatch repair protein MutS [Prevotella sp.]MCM1408160.1 DNA mismatch repair protein MutS [Treponema brennaborense]MCM1469484.1 DNA mismatch repair protein MutS [Bacteroides sp.]